MLVSQFQPSEFNPKGVYVMYGGQGRATVYVQGGVLFDGKGVDLMYKFLSDPDKSRFKNILYWMNYHGYAMNSELRLEVVKLRRQQELEMRMQEEMARLDKMQQEEMANLEKELEDAQRRARLKTLGPLPPDPKKEIIPELELTEAEKNILGFEDDTEEYLPDASLGDDEVEEYLPEEVEEEITPEPVKPALKQKSAAKPRR